MFLFDREWANLPFLETATLIPVHLRIMAGFAFFLLILFGVVSLYSSVPLRISQIPGVAEVTYEDPLFRHWTREWQALTYRIRAILDDEEPEFMRTDIREFTWSGNAFKPDS